MKKKKILIYGAGAIGRGYIPWVFSPDIYDYYYVEKSDSIYDNLKKMGRFTSFKTESDQYASLEILIQDVFKPGQEADLIKEADVIITAVGPRNFLGLSALFNNIKTPILCCENDSTLPKMMREATDNPNVVFVIPDVITSNTSSAAMAASNPLNIITENGVCFIDDRVSHLEANCQFADEKELEKQWAAKLYIHNTPHCIAAYLGSILNVTFLHESMQFHGIEKIVRGAMYEMLQMLLKRTDIDEDFLNFYCKKEFDRFKNNLLFDPISRVAREPFRKLGPKDRLIGAAQLCLSVGIVPENILIGIMAAFYFDNKDDPDAHIRYLRDSLTPKDFLTTIFRLNDSEALFMLLESGWDRHLTTLRNLK
jgi:mannitol-1-phosphate 5-dehydrogenase